MKVYANNLDRSFAARMELCVFTTSMKYEEWNSAKADLIRCFDICRFRFQPIAKKCELKAKTLDEFLENLKDISYVDYMRFVRVMEDKLSALSKKKYAEA